MSEPPTRCLRSSSGYYLQGAYTVWQSRVTPHPVRPLGALRHGRRLRRHTAGLPHRAGGPGFGRQALATTERSRLDPGANFYINPHVVFKADYQTFDVNSDLSRFDLGMGLNF